jgi:hypothetical protein
MNGLCCNTTGNEYLWKRMTNYFLNHYSLPPQGSGKEKGSGWEIVPIPIRGAQHVFLAKIGGNSKF